MKKALVVDDNKVVSAAYQNLLRVDGLAVETAFDGAQALALMADHMPDVVLLDLKLPKIDGLTVLKRLREMPSGQGIPVIVFTESHVPAMINSAWESGATLVLSKASSPPKAVVAAVRKALADTDSPPEALARNGAQADAPASSR